MRMVCPRGLAWLVAMFVTFATATAVAAVPPLKLAAARQASLRKEAGKAKLDVAVTVTAGDLASFGKSGMALAGAKGLSLPAKGGDGALELGEGELVPWKVVWVLLTSKNPVDDLQEQVGKLDATTGIDTLDGRFVYVYGSTPAVAFSRDLGRIRRITAKSDEHIWEFRLSGELGMAGLPERIHILRSGEPYANVELSRTSTE